MEIEVVIDEAISELIPRFLANVRREIRAMRQALEAGMLEEVRRLGHALKGAGYGYGFVVLGDMGQAIEADAAGRAPAADIAARLDAVEDYLARVRVRFEPNGA